MRREVLYNAECVNNYLREYEETPMDIIDGSLLDTYIIYHAPDLIEVLEETYVNCWQSAYKRHIYKKGLPKRFEKALEEQAEEMALIYG